MQQNGINIIEVFVGEINSAQTNYSHSSKAISEDLRKCFHHTLQVSFPNPRFVLLQKIRETNIQNIKSQNALILTYTLHAAGKESRG